MLFITYGNFFIFLKIYFASFPILVHLPDTFTNPFYCFKNSLRYIPPTKGHEIPNIFAETEMSVRKL